MHVEEARGETLAVGSVLCRPYPEPSGNQASVDGLFDSHRSALIFIGFTKHLLNTYYCVSGSVPDPRETLIHMARAS